MQYVTATTFLACLCYFQIVSAEAVQVPLDKSDHGLIGGNDSRELLQQCKMNVTGFNLIDARTGTVLKSLPKVINYDNDIYATGLNIVAKLSNCRKPNTAQSVKLDFDDPAVSFCSNRRKGVPFSVFGVKESSKGIKFRPMYFPLGYRTVGATPYYLPNCTGKRAKRVSSTFEVRGCLDGFNFYDADTDLIFTGNLANPPCNLNIEAKISDKCAFPVKSVILNLTDFGGNVVASHTDTQSPYLLYGDSNSDIQPLQLPTGFYRITASLNGRGPSLFASFTLGECAPPQPAPSSVPTTTPTAPKPSPTTDVPSIAPTNAVLLPTTGCTSISIRSILGLDSPLFQVGDINVIDLMYSEYQDILEMTGVSLGMFLPEIICADSDEDVASRGGDAGVTSCEKLDFLPETDVLGFGFEDSGVGFCAAINPYTNTYALAQVGILPTVTIFLILTLSLDAVGFSLTKQLSKNTLNDMWDGTSSPAPIDVWGHVVVRGTASIGFKLSSRVSCSIDIDASFVIDADYLNNGVADIFAGNHDTIDFAVLFSGAATPSFDISSIKDGKEEVNSLDLSTLIEVDVDIYLVVDGDATALQLAASLKVSLQGICDASPYLGIVCDVFDGTSGFEGAVRLYARTDAFGVQFAISGRFAFQESILNTIVGWGDDGASFSASVELRIAGDDVVACATISDTIIQNWCIDFCNNDSDCAADSFCIVGFCFPRLDDGTYCLDGTTCNGCKNGYESWWKATPIGYYCGQEPRYADGTLCALGTSCDHCQNGYESWWKATPIGYYCGQEPRYADGTLCALGTSCDHCQNGYETWWQATPLGYYCGQEPRYSDGTYCLDGTSCGHCQNGYEWWYKANGGTPGNYCGQEPRYSDGTYCLDGTSCYHCQNGYEWWYKANGGTPGNYCGQEPRYADGTYCLAGTSCYHCQNGYEWWYTASPNGYYCGRETRFADGTYCLAGTTCDHCQNSASWWYGPTPNGYYCGTEPCWGDGTYCLDGTSCNRCCNYRSWWYSKTPNGNYCGNEPCWGSGAYCLLGSSCDRCCNGNHYVWYLASTFCN